MNLLTLALILALLANDAYGDPPKTKKQSEFDKFLKALFLPKSPVTKKHPATPKKKTTTSSEPTPREKRKTHVVDAEWMARYLEQEATWDYPIPDDDLIKFKDGNYHVPTVVFKHYEDMLNTSRRAPTPTPIPRPQPTALP